MIFGEQMTIFDFLEADDARRFPDKYLERQTDIEEYLEFPDFRTMTDEAIANFIGERVGLDFKFDNSCPSIPEYKVTINKIDFTVHTSHYTCYGELEGQPFISCGVQKQYGDYQGRGCPIDDLESAVEFFRTNKKAFLGKE